jgi:hypothetical protein
MKEGHSHHRGKHTSKTPHVQAVIVLLEIYQEFGAFEVAGRHTDIVFDLWMVELGQTPINES